MIPSLRKILQGKAGTTKSVLSRNVASEENSQCYKIIKGFTNIDANKLFSSDDLSRTRSNGIKLRCRQIELDCTKFFFY